MLIIITVVIIVLVVAIVILSYVIAPSSIDLPKYTYRCAT
jgi:hypothetical protein